MTTYMTGSNGIRQSGALTGSSVPSSATDPQKPWYESVTSGQKGRSDELRQRNLERALASTQRAAQPFDRALLGRARELLESIDPQEQVTATVNLAEIGTMIAGLWETADRSTAIHCQILAALDTGILSALAADSITPEQLDVFREAMGDLSMDIVSESQAEAVRSRLIDLGKRPLFIVSDVKDDLADDEHAPEN